MEAVTGTEPTRTEQATSEPPVHRGWRIAVCSVMVLVGLVHVLPAVALVAPQRLEGLYGITGLTADEVLLMRHRALLLGLVGLVQFIAVIRPAVTATALVVALLSTGSFVLLAVEAGASGPLRQVALVDVVLLPLIVAAMAITLRSRRRATSPPASDPVPAVTGR
ncbi:hypothetical protein NUM3379_41080 [Kineococcus sp. NUM-3379]